MSKKQKIWLGVFLAMFIIPELLWSLVGNTLYALITDRPFRDNFLMHADYRNLLFFVVLVQSMGIVATLVALLKNKAHKFLKEGRIIVFISSAITLITLFVLYILFATKDIGF